MYISIIYLNRKSLAPYDFFHRRLHLWQSTTPVRRPLPKAKYGLPISSYYLGQIMDYAPSRKTIYCPTYAGLIKNSPQLQQLQQMYANGENLLILAPDGLADYNTELTQETLIKLVNDPTIIFGHELVLCSLLLGYEVWKL